MRIAFEFSTGPQPPQGNGEGQQPGAEPIPPLAHDLSAARSTEEATTPPTEDPALNIGRTPAENPGSEGEVTAPALPPRVATLLGKIGVEMSRKPQGTEPADTSSEDDIPPPRRVGDRWVSGATDGPSNPYNVGPDDDLPAPDSARYNRDAARGVAATDLVNDDLPVPRTPRPTV